MTIINNRNDIFECEYKISCCYFTSKVFRKRNFGDKNKLGCLYREGDGEVTRNSVIFR